MIKNKKLLSLIIALCMIFILPACELDIEGEKKTDKKTSSVTTVTSSVPKVTSEGPSVDSDGNIVYTINSVPEFTSEPFVAINNNVPYFTDADYMTKAYESYGDLDSLGRCTVTLACVCKETMPTEKRGNISQVKPTGWQTAKYDFVDGQYLYNRCHLIGYQLTAENANKQNLITGTRYLNVDGMLPFENMVADYVKETNNHVMYRVTPIFDGDNLVARGVLMEGYSVEDNGEGVCFNVYAYNNQPGVVIDYATGKSRLAGSTETSSEVREYVVNTNNKKIHLPDCDSVSSMKDSNKKTVTGTLEEFIAQGYIPCGNCLKGA